MQYSSSKKFDKRFAKLTQKIREQFIESVKIFQQNPFDPKLNNHSVHYPYDGCRSINITGDVRAIYEPKGYLAFFIRIGSHSELYK
mgnify:FL=1